MIIPIAKLLVTPNKVSFMKNFKKRILKEITI